MITQTKTTQTANPSPKRTKKTPLPTLTIFLKADANLGTTNINAI